MPGAQAQRRGVDTQTRLGMREGQMRVDIQAPQTPRSRGAALQTFYELALTREEEQNWFQDSPELRSIMETFLTSYKWRLICEDEQTGLHYAACVTQKGWGFEQLLSWGKHHCFKKLYYWTRMNGGLGLNLFIHSTGRVFSELSVPHAFLQTCTSHKVVGLWFPCT